MIASEAAERRKRGRKCHVCSLPPEQRAEVERGLIVGENIEGISRKFAVSADSVAGHRSHLPRAALAEAAAAAAEAEGLRGAGLLAKASSLLKSAEAMMIECRADGDRANALRAIREAGRLLATIAKLTGQIDDSATINVVMAGPVLQLQQVVLAALANHPAARLAVVEALGRTEGPPLLEHQP